MSSMMISVENALNLVLEQTRDYGVEKVDLLQSPGRILAGSVTADRDFPPFHRVMMDGIAIDSSTFAVGQRVFPVQEIQAAGSPRAALKKTGNCIEVMTGAILPGRADAVVPYEVCDIESGVATIKSNRVSSFQYVHSQGVDAKKGDVLVEPGRRINSAVIGVMATVGLSRVPVRRLPSVAVCSTGDELVEIDRKPQPHQIRRSNSYMLSAALQNEGINPDSFHLPDEKEAIRKELSSIKADHDVILLSGAVSKGKFDYLPEALGELGMKTIFHRVAQKPGKPFLFGSFDDGTLVFGFPGNPVSTFVCYHYYFKSWLRRSIRFQEPLQRAKLVNEVNFSPALTYHMPVRFDFKDGVMMACSVGGSGSGDLVSLTKADGFVTLPPDRDHFEKGESFDATLFR